MQRTKSGLSGPGASLDLAAFTVGSEREQVACFFVLCEEFAKNHQSIHLAFGGVFFLIIWVNSVLSCLAEERYEA